MTNREAVVLSAYTGFMIAKQFSDIHRYIEEILERPVYPHELANKKIHKEIQEKSKKEFIEIINNIKD